MTRFGITETAHLSVACFGDMYVMLGRKHHSQLGFLDNGDMQLNLPSTIIHSCVEAECEFRLLNRGPNVVLLPPPPNHTHTQTTTWYFQATRLLI